MKKTKLCAGLSTCCMLAALSVFTLPANADEGYIYGTMNIPYDEFYEAEGVGYEVDAVSSATTSKWKNENLTAGTYNQPNADETGTILGVNYYVALTEETLAALGENNYNFTAVETTPSAYKVVTVDETGASFSAVQGNSAPVNASAAISTDTPWGDYQITVDAINNGNGTSDIGRIYGVVLTTQKGDCYALRHLENIWRDNLAWSNGFVTKEPHGNTLNYEDFEGLMGQTITEITYITESGYHNLAVSLYVPVKFNYTLSAADAKAADGKTTVTLADFPADYNKTYSIENLNAQISDSEITYQNALPGEYTLTVSDANGVYADAAVAFVLSTDENPAVYKDGKLAKAEGASDENFANFVKNIASVSVNETEYAATGKRGVKIITEDGTVDLAAEQNKSKIFGENGTYKIVVTATGYTAPLEFTLTVGETAQAADLKTTDSPKTGVPGLAVPAILAAVSAAGAATVARKRK